MRDKPSFKVFAKTTLINKNFYFVYKDEKYNKMYKETNARRKRLKKEFYLILLPILIYFLFFISKNQEWFISVNKIEIVALIIMGISPFVLIALHLASYNRVRFQEIKSVEEAEDTKIKPIEFVFALIFILEIVYVTYSIVIMKLM